MPALPIVALTIPVVRLARHRPAPQDDEDEPMRAEVCALAGQVKLCTNHASMQLTTCASDDLDCQCTWAGVMTTCFSPCIGDPTASGGMQTAKGHQDTICAQAAKFGKIAKDRERQRLDEKNNKGRKKEQTMTSFPRDINDLNASHEAASTLLPSAGAGSAPRAKPRDDGIVHATGVAPSADGKAGKGLLPGGDKQIPVVESNATAKTVAKLGLALFAVIAAMAV
ncbi:hypothetical protein GGI03_001103 [Coemansia sp. RSA 2337]|nr:hypothetical protein H4S04_001686 [Coemansia sp. S16]KAJ2061383.1 hypothetical protein GGH13_006632 [Coemansia sp. S155-1]KAJ2069804.1 hypothetical protein GGI08_000170 [Coemansia sp. S2]KAJ2117663.1 hypothetical protein IW146_000565 [Coemansia sp. RSA 922]KAJ2345357.1 hypothetical protein GGH92_004080 [Coemansia sp. RSA 2673]KAJ2468245.1 hypothetical protein GGI03_001103 [Coemansia sp. RSA 2337]